MVRITQDLPQPCWHWLTGGTFDSATGGTFQSDTDGTFHSDIPGTFESDMGGTFKVLQSNKIRKMHKFVVLSLADAILFVTLLLLLDHNVYDSK